VGEGWLSLRPCVSEAAENATLPLFPLLFEAKMTNHSAAGTCRGLLRASLLSLTLSVGVVGCSGGGLAPVTGKVTYQGQPVKGGTLIFSPVGGEKEVTTGKSASGEIKDGTYTLTTNRPGDGAKIGRHRVIFTPPEPERTEEQRTNPKVKTPPTWYVGLAPKESEVTVKAGSNTIDIELVPRK